MVAKWWQIGVRQEHHDASRFTGKGISGRSTGPTGPDAGPVIAGYGLSEALDFPPSASFYHLHFQLAFFRGN